MTHRDVADLGNMCYCENQVFYQKFEIKAKLKQFPTLFLRHSLETILDTELKRFHVAFFELEMLEIFTRAFFTKNHVAVIATLSSVVKFSP